MSKIKLTIEMPLPINTPDGNGHTYSRAAVREAVRTMDGVPITYNGEEIGFVDAGYLASEQEHSAVLRLHATISAGIIRMDGDTVEFDGDGRIVKYRISEVAFCE